MRQKSKDADGMKIERRRVGRKPRRDACLRLRKGHAGGIVDGDVPARQFGRDALGKRAVGSQEGRRAAWRVEGFAERDGGRKGFIALIHGLDQLDALAARGDHVRAHLRRHGGPAVGRVGGPQRLRQHSASGPDPIVCEPQSPHCRPRYLEVTLQEPAKHRLRMPVDRVAVVGFEATNRRPARLVELGVEPRQHHRAVRQPRDRIEKSRGRRNGARRPGRDDRPRRRLTKEPLRLCVNQRAAASSRVARLPLRQELGPVLRGDAHEIERQAKVFRVVGLDGLGELIPGYVFRRKAVHQAFEVAGEIDRVRRRRRHEKRSAGLELQAGAVDGLRPGLDEAGENQAAFERSDRRGQRIGLFKGGVSGQLELRVVGLTQRHDARKQLRAPLSAVRQKGREGPRGPAGRQIDGRVGQSPLIGVIEDLSFDQGIREHRQKRGAGRNREDAWLGHQASKNARSTQVQCGCVRRLR